MTIQILECQKQAMWINNDNYIANIMLNAVQKAAHIFNFVGGFAVATWLLDILVMTNPRN